MNIRHRASRLSMLLSICVAIVSCSGGGEGGGGDTTQPPPPSTNRGTLLQDVLSAYPRLVRLGQQADATRNGRIIASVTQNISGVWQAGIHSSSDGGTTFTRIGAVQDTDFQKGLCCGTLFELPQAVGTLPVGTLLYSASVGADTSGTTMENRIYRSLDAGASWSFLSLCGRARVPRVNNQGNGVWEPEFSIAATGELVCHYSDETVSGKSQVLTYVKTSDGINWSVPQLTVAGDDPNQRPGMAVVRKLPNGKYFMSFENCFGGPLDCSVRYKLSTDGLNWGSANDLGTRIQTASGQFFRHAPTVAWAPVAGQPQGMLVVIGQILNTSAGTVDANGNGKTMFVNTAPDGAGAWRAVDTPIALLTPPQVTNWCQNYSTPLLPSSNGQSILLMQTDGAADASCRARFGSGALPQQ